MTQQRDHSLEPKRANREALALGSSSRVEI